MANGSKLMERIRKNFSNMSKGQKRLAEYITTHYDRAAFLTAANLGKTVGLSESTVVRFAYALGYNGYPDLQKDIQEMVKQKLSTVERLELSADYLGNESILKKVLQTDIENIKLTMEEISERVFDTVVDEILKANRIYIIGLRSATSQAYFLGYYLNLILRNVNIVTLGLNDLFEQLLAAGKGDVVIGISFPRYTRNTVEAFKFAKELGATAIAITDSDLSPLGRIADHTLTAKSDMASFIDSFVAPLSVINSLIIAVGMKKKDKISKSLKVLEDVWENYNVFMAKKEKHNNY
jgi:DNA-binding MurR/RpiR family transcriptional regulator